MIVSTWYNSLSSKKRVSVNCKVGAVAADVLKIRDARVVPAFRSTVSSPGGWSRREAMYMKSQQGSNEQRQ